MNAEELTLELIASLWEESRKIATVQAHLRGDHAMSRNDIVNELTASHNRRYSLNATHEQVMER